MKWLPWLKEEHDGCQHVRCDPLYPIKYDFQPILHLENTTAGESNEFNKIQQKKKENKTKISLLKTTS